MNPILKYPGAKWRLAEWIIDYMPPHEGYLELFFGSGAVFFNKPKSRVETVNDLDGNVVRFFRACREHPDELAKALALTPWSRAELAQSDYTGPLDDVEFARRFAVRYWMTFGSRQTSKTWRCVTGAYKDGGPELLIYADPPYVHSTRTKNGDQYAHEMTDTDHEALLKALNQSQSMVLLSGYDCELYRDMLTGWQMEQKRTTAERGIPRTECLWINPAVQARLDTQLSLEG